MEINDDLLSVLSVFKNRIMKTTHICDVGKVISVDESNAKIQLVNSPKVQIDCYVVSSLSLSPNDYVVVIYTDKDTRQNLVSIKNGKEPQFVEEDRTYHSLDYGIIINKI